MRLLVLIIALMAASMASPALAGDREIAAIEAVFSPAGLDAGMFTEDFLKQVPAAQITAIVGVLSAASLLTAKDGNVYCGRGSGTAGRRSMRAA